MNAPTPRHRLRRLMPNFRVLALLACSACVSAPTGPEEPNPLVIDGDVRILFVGNSLTYTNNLPGTVEAVAAAAGLDVGTGMIAFPNFSLADHWNRGLGDVIQEVAEQGGLVPTRMQV